MTPGHVRYALRLARRTPLLAAAVVLTLAGGIAATTSVFGLVNAVWFEPLPYPEADRLVVVHQKHAHDGYADRLSPAAYDAWRGRTCLVEATGAYVERSFALGRPGAHAERVRGVAVSSSLLEMLGAQPIAGRRLGDADERPGAPAVALVSQRFWRQRLSDANAAGTVVRLDGVQTTIVGVLPYEFRLFNSGFDVFIPLPPAAASDESVRAALPDAAPRADARILNVVVRLRTGATPAAAASEIAALAASDRRPDGDGWQPVLLSLEQTLRGTARTAYLLLLGVTALLLLVICANVANILLARSVLRRQEFAVRVALGAGHRSILVQLVTEGVLLGLTAGAIAFLLCTWMRHLLVAAYPEMVDLRVDWRVFAFAFAASILVGSGLGLAPALPVLSEEAGWAGTSGPRSAGRRKHRLGSLLAVAQMAAAATLLIGCGLLLNGALALRSVDPGFATENVLTAAISLPPGEYPTGAQRRALLDEIESRLGRVPGVRAAALASVLPLDGGVTTIALQATGRRESGGQGRVRAAVKSVSSAYFRAIGASTVAGDLFGPDEMRRVAIVNEAFARSTWGGASSAVGESVRIGDGGWWRVVGVVGDVRQVLTEAASPEICLPLRADPPATASIIVKTATPPEDAAPRVRGIVHRLDPDLALADVVSMQGIVNSYIPAPFVGAFGVLSVASLLLGSLGLYAVVAFQVARRTRELGIRSALGADTNRLLRLVLGEGLRLTFAGLGVGVVLSVVLGLALSRALLDVAVFDAAVTGLVAALLAVVSCAACFLPARRATRIDPAVALRCE